MKEPGNLPILIGEIQKHRQVLNRIVSFKDSFHDKHQDWKTLDTEAAMAIAQHFCNFYTCIETIFFRISSFFENNLEKDRWHSHLLNRMTFEIPTERPRVIEDHTASQLQEFLKFRHFSRYYFDFDYDREKLAFLGGKFDIAVKGLEKDLDRFLVYLDELSK